MKPIDFKDGLCPHVVEVLAGFVCGGREDGPTYVQRICEEPCTMADYMKCDALMPQTELTTPIATDRVVPKGVRP